MARGLRITKSAITHIAKDKALSASIAIKVARFVKIGIDDLLTGKFAPPGTCPHCGRPA